ncbi:MAG: hypothetical protein AAGG50_19235 [Bacteroidota bacterium]
MDFSDSIGLLLFLFFLFLQFISSLLGKKRKGQPLPPGEGFPSEGFPGENMPGDGFPDDGATRTRSPEAVPTGDGASTAEPAPARRPAPTSFEEALRQIQEALREASQPPRPKPEPVPEPARAEVPDEENAPAFQHFDDFEKHGDAHFSSGAHDRYESARAEKRSRYADYEGVEAKRGRATRSSTRKPLSGPVPQSETGPNAVGRLRKKLRSPDAVQDAYRLHVILGEPRARRRY